MLTRSNDKKVAISINQPICLMEILPFTSLLAERSKEIKRETAGDRERDRDRGGER